MLANMLLEDQFGGNGEGKELFMITGFQHHGSQHLGQDDEGCVESFPIVWCNTCNVLFDFLF